MTTVPADGGLLSGTTSGSSAFSGSCGNTATSPEQVFAWTPNVSGAATIETCSSTSTTFDTVLYLRDGSCGSGAELACNDDTSGCGTTLNPGDPRWGSRLTPTVTAGHTYFIVVDGYGGRQGQFQLAVIPPGSQDACASATVIPPQGGTFTGATRGASTLAGSCGSSGGAPEQVFAWTPSTSGPATIETCSATATTYDTVLYLRDGTCGDGTEVACNDDTSGCGTTTDTSNPHRGSRLTPVVTAAHTYYIVVDGYSTSSGTFSLHVVPPA